MTLTACRIDAFRLPLRPPLVFRRGRVAFREGLLLGLRDENGREGWGEISPLPHWHRETVAAARDQLQAAWPKLRQRGLTEAPDADAALSSLKHLRLFPSVRFGVESAWCHLQAARLGKTLAAFLNPGAAGQVSLIGLLQGSPSTIRRDAKELAASGYRDFKLKVGTSLASDLQNIATVRDIIAPESSLLLDANRAWSWSAGTRFAKLARDFNIAYIEEPLQDPNRCADFYRETGMAYAWDETLQPPERRLPRRRAGLRALVIKPSLIGGLRAARRDCRRAHAWGARAVISSAYETGLGLATLAHLAAASAGQDRAAVAGLDTWRWLGADIAVPPFQPHSATWRLAAQPAVDRARVREVWRG